MADDGTDIPTRELSPNIAAEALAQLALMLDGETPWDCRLDIEDAQPIGNGQVRFSGHQRSPQGVATPIAIVATVVIERRS